MFKRDLQQRPTKFDQQKKTYKRDLQKRPRPVKHISTNISTCAFSYTESFAFRKTPCISSPPNMFKRDLQKRPTKFDQQKETYKKDLQKRPRPAEHISTNISTRAFSKTVSFAFRKTPCISSPPDTFKRDLQKRPTNRDPQKETSKRELAF